MAAVTLQTPVPLVLAVVGHRDPLPEALPRLRQLFRTDLEQLLAAMPNTPLLMLNGLACGMDSEAAEVFLEVCPGHRLVAALPKRPDHYRQDFAPGPELERLERLLQRCAAVLHPGNCPELRGGAPEGEELPSPACYGQQGLFLVRHSYLVFAFSNGVETMEVGGTSQTVALQKGEVHPLFCSVEEVIASLEPGALIEYDTPRHKNRLAEDLSRPERACWLQARNVASVAALLTIPTRLEQLNRTAAGSSRRPCWAGLTPAGRIDRVAQRCLGETSSVQEVWAVTGVETDCADLLQSRMHPALHWVRTWLRASRLQHLSQLQAAAPAAWDQAHQWLLTQYSQLERECQRRRDHRPWIGQLLLVAVAASLGGVVGIALALGVLLLAEALRRGEPAEARRSRRRRDQLGRCLRAYEQALYTDAAEPQRELRLRCALEAAGRDTLDELNDWVSAQLR
jgi:hypothetical protein